MAQDFDHDIDDLVGKDERNIQPHLGSLELKDSSALEHINPAFDDGDGDEVFTDNSKAAKNNNQGFEDNFNDINIPSNSQFQTSPVSSKETSLASPKEDNEATNRTSYPVIFTNGGQNNVVQEEVVIKKPDGSKVIKTEHFHYNTQPYQKRRRPLTKNRILLLKILSVVAVVVYFPLGIPAVYFAFNIQKEFDAGIINGNIDKAQKYAGRAEKLVIFSGLFAILTLVLVVSLVERTKGSDKDNSILHNRVLPGG